MQNFFVSDFTGSGPQPGGETPQVRSSQVREVLRQPGSEELNRVGHLQAGSGNLHMLA
jgi:hypothetical protein